MSELKLEYKSDFSRAQKYWDAFWNREIIDRPCTIIYAKKDLKYYAMSFQPVEDDFNLTLSAAKKFMESIEFLGEAIPGFRPGFGPDQMAAFLGMPLTINPESRDTSWTEKIVSDWKDFMPLQLDEKNPVWRRMLEFHKASEEFCKGKCQLFNIDLHSNIDCLEAMRGSERLLFDLIDKPEIVDELMKQVRPVYKKIYNELWKFGDKAKIGSNSGMHLYSRGKTDYIQADFISLLTPEMFRRFALPAIEEEAAFLDDAAFHLDGPGALPFLDDILAVEKIKFVQWLPGAGRKPNFQWPEVINKIQSAGKLTIIYASPDEVKYVHQNCDYKPELLVYEVYADNKQQGLELLDWLKKNT